MTTNIPSGEDGDGGGCPHFGSVQFISVFLYVVSTQQSSTKRMNESLILCYSSSHGKHASFLVQEMNPEDL